MELEQFVDDILFPSERLEFCSVSEDDVVVVTNYRIICLLENRWVILFRRMIKSFTFSHPHKCVYIKRFDLLLMRVNLKSPQLLKEFEDCLNRTQPDCPQPALHVYESTPKPYRGPLKTRSQWMRDSLELGRDDCDVMKFEMKRLDFYSDPRWRVTDANQNYGLSPTYPKTLLVPSVISDPELTEIANFRSKGRIPSVVWRCSWNETVIMRCSQPQYGFFGRRCAEDEKLISAVSEIYRSDFELDGLRLGGVRIVDCRAYSSAEMNRARGGGREYHTYYGVPPVIFLGIPNIHTVRSYGNRMRDDSSRFVGHDRALDDFPDLPSDRWLNTIGDILSGSNRCVFEMFDYGRSLLIHCSDGWDRTAQISSLVQIQMDPYYRTIIGFQVLVEKEWILHGHCFSTRCRTNLSNAESQNEHSPIFLQWIECVYQLLIQFAYRFEFNEEFLVRLVQHIYSGFFGEFLCSCERESAELNDKTFSLWSFLTPGDKSFVNPRYVPCEMSPQNIIFSNTTIVEFWKRLHFDCSRSLDISTRDSTSRNLVLVPFKYGDGELSLKYQRNDFQLFMDLDGLASYRYTEIEQEGISFLLNDLDYLSDSASELDFSESPAELVEGGSVCHVCTRSFLSNTRHCCLCGLCICNSCIGYKNMFSWDYRLKCIYCTYNI